MATCTDDIWRDIQGKKIYPVTEYSMSNRIALLINNIHFCEPSLNRYGAEKDEEAMVYLLHKLRYEVVRCRDLTAQSIYETLITFSKHPKLVHTDSVFVVLMSHGNVGIISGSDQKDFEIDQIYERLNTKNCPALLNKPKVIIIQACRGGNAGVFQFPGRRELMATENIRFSPKNFAKGATVHVEKDFISFLSSTPHTYSYRIEAYGSYFIQHIVNVFLSWCHEDDIEELFKKVMQHFEDSPSEYMQMPTKERDTLTKRFYLLLGFKHLFPGEEPLRMRLEALRLNPFGDQQLRSDLRKYSFQLAIDTNTVSKWLKLSDDKRNVTPVEKVQSYPNHPDRFDCPQMLCRNVLTGRCYWEVECSGTVHISVSYRRIRRKGVRESCMFGRNDHSWSLYHSVGCGYYVWHNNRRTFISDSLVKDRVAVYVDCPAGTLSFFRVSSDTLIHLHTVNTKFTEPLYPGCSLTAWPPGSSVTLCKV